LNVLDPGVNKVLKDRLAGTNKFVVDMGRNDAQCAYWAWCGISLEDEDTYSNIFQLNTAI
jgi:hypothetical protein